jgi:hypothetical protein
MSELTIRDNASVAQDPAFEALVKKITKGATERVVYSGRIVKMSSKGMPNLRVLVVTDKAVYNLPVSDYSTLKRRIVLEHITFVTASRISSEVVLHVPSEYDFRFQIVMRIIPFFRVLLLTCFCSLTKRKS